MGVYINMEMPTSCDKCLYSAWSNFYQIYVCNAIRKDEPVLFDGKQVKSTAVSRSGIADNCPLVPVPPHGRLIDGDVAEAIHFTSEDADGKDFYDGILFAADFISQQPTIIPAEEGET